DLPDTGFEIEDPRRSVELAEHVAKHRVVSRHVAPGRNAPSYLGPARLVNIVGSHPRGMRSSLKRAVVVAAAVWLGAPRPIWISSRLAISTDPSGSRSMRR